MYATIARALADNDHEVEGLLAPSIIKRACRFVRKRNCADNSFWRISGHGIILRAIGIGDAAYGRADEEWRKPS